MEDKERLLEVVEPIFEQLNNLKENQEIELERDWVGWKGFHPHMDQSEGASPFLSIVRKDDKGIFVEGLMKPQEEGNEVLLHWTRNKNGDCEVKVLNGEDELNVPNVDMVITAQRGGHGPMQVSAAGVLFAEKGLRTKMFSPVPDVLDSSVIGYISEWKYAEEVGYTTNLGEDRSGQIHPSLPTDKHADRSLLTLMALTSSNWHLFKQMCNTSMSVSDSKAEAGRLATAVKRGGLNSDLKIVQILYGLFDQPENMHELVDRDLIWQRIQEVGLGDWGMPDFLRFMNEKAIALDLDGILLHMSTKEARIVEAAASNRGFNNVVSIPLLCQINTEKFPTQEDARSRLEIHEDEKVVLLKFSSSPHPQAQEIFELIKCWAEVEPDTKFQIMGNLSGLCEDEVMKFKNIEFLGWISKQEMVFERMAAADTILTLSGTINSGIEGLGSATQCDVLPLFITPGEVSEATVGRLKGEPMLDVKGNLNLDKLLTIMMWSETMEERHGNMAALIGDDEVLRKLVIDPTRDGEVDRIRQVLKQRSELLRSVRERASQLNIGNANTLAGILSQILNGATSDDLKKQRDKV